MNAIISFYGFFFANTLNWPDGAALQRIVNFDETFMGGGDVTQTAKCKCKFNFFPFLTFHQQ